MYVNIVLADYLAASDDKMKGLMSRHRTLSDSNVHLVNNLESMADEVCSLVVHNFVTICVHCALHPGLEVISLEFIPKLKIKRNDWLLADMCPQAANHCALF